MSINIDQWHANIGSFIQKIGRERTGSIQYYRHLNKPQGYFILLYTSFDSWWQRSQPWDYKKNHSSYGGSCPLFSKISPFLKSKMPPLFIGLSGKQK